MLEIPIRNARLPRPIPWRTTSSSAGGLSRQAFNRVTISSGTKRVRGNIGWHAAWVHIEGTQLPNGIEQDIRFDVDYLRKTFLAQPTDR